MSKKSKIISISSWCLYDWASASFSSIITTFIFATYFTTSIAENKIVGTYQWANATSIIGLIIAVCSPLFGSIADHGGNHKIWLFLFTMGAVIFSSLLWFAYPSHVSVFYTLTCVVLGTVCYEISQVFYNAFLPTLISDRYIGRVSGWGWGAGYFGGIASLTIVLIFFVKLNIFNLNTATAEQIRMSGPFVGVWFALFSLPLFMFLPSIGSKGKLFFPAVKAGIKELSTTIKKLPKEKNILLFLFARMLYTDGLNTLFAFGGIYAAGTYGLSFEEVLLFGITMNITAGIGAILLASLDDWLGSKLTILLSLVCLTLFGIPLLILQQKYIFWGVALLLCLFVGPAQAASRSLMVRLIANKNATGEMFGLYALSGKITAFLGPWILGMITLTFGSQRYGMGTILLFFIIGGFLLLPVQIIDKNEVSV